MLDYPKPREGTETHYPGVILRFNGVLDYPKPREGTETRSLAMLSILPPLKLDYPKPREGTETSRYSGVHPYRLASAGLPQAPRGDGN